jgi:hypothetical protein
LPASLLQIGDLSGADDYPLGRDWQRHRGVPANVVFGGSDMQTL